ncbi:MAG TPA: enzyme of heme biosynthesis [Cytophagales bacterium]|jgi:Tfp pilus assembly protein PilF|nr:enzyme of heme biosynthesis [Cytophagales bacterium]
MKNDRLAQLLAFFEEDPSDSFTLYAIAIEYLKVDQSKSLKYFDQLLKQHPEYLPTYYHAAAAYSESGQRDIAEMIYKKGISLAEKQGDQHALSELKNAYTNFEMDDLI